MTKEKGSKQGGLVFVGLGLILTVVIALTGSARKEPTRLGDGSPSLASPSASELTPGAARAETDTLDLQLD